MLVSCRVCKKLFKPRIQTHCSPKCYRTDKKRRYRARKRKEK